MTQPPYVPPRDDDASIPADSGWSTSQDLPAGQQSDSELFASQFPATGDSTTVDSPYSQSSYGERSYTEPVSSVTITGDYSDESSTKDVAKEQAGAVKDTAVEQGQHVAGVAKEQAGAVKDTAVEQGQHVAGVAKEQAGAVKDTAVEQGQHVAGVAKEQVTAVAAEASVHVKDLLSEGLTEVRSQAGTQQKRLAAAVHSLADELGTMASKSESSGPLTGYAQQASHRGGEIAHWLENAEPSELLDSVRSFARRRPALFLGVSALAGVVAGRLTRGFVANAKNESSTPAVTSGYTSAPQYAVETTPVRDSLAYSDIPTTGTGYAGTTGTAGYVDDTTPTYGTTDPYVPNDGVTR